MEPARPPALKEMLPVTLSRVLFAEIFNLLRPCLFPERTLTPFGAFSVPPSCVCACGWDVPAASENRAGSHSESQQAQTSWGPANCVL